MTAKVSIVMPAYNSAATIEAAIASVLAQDYEDWELIVYDDGSTDQTEEIVKTMALNCQKIRYFKHANGGNYGPAYVRNCAVRESVGALLAFLDADDLWLPIFLRQRVGKLDEGPDIAMVWGPAWYFGDHIKPYLQPTGLSQTERFDPPQMVEHFIKNLRGTPCPSGALMRRDKFGAVGGFEEGLRRGEDISLWVKVAQRFSISYDSEVLFQYRRHSQSSTSKSNQSGQRNIWDEDFFIWLLNYVRANKSSASILNAAANGYRGFLQKSAGVPWPRSRMFVFNGLYKQRLLKQQWPYFLMSLWLPVNIANRLVRRIFSITANFKKPSAK